MKIKNTKWKNTIQNEKQKMKNKIKNILFLFFFHFLFCIDFPFEHLHAVLNFNDGGVF